MASADIRIEEEKEGNYGIYGADESYIEMPRPTEPQIVNIRTEFEKRIRDFKGNISETIMIKKDESRMVNAIKPLREWGQRLFIKLFFQEGPKYRKILDLFENAHGHFLTTGRPCIIEIDSRIDRMLPWEFMVLPTQWSEVKTLKDIFKRFIGLSFIIKRVVQKTEIPNLSVDNSNGMVVKYFYHDGLSGARKEFRFFQDNKHVNLRGPWPTHKVNEFSNQIGEHIYHTLSNFDGQQQQAFDHIQHFSCHCKVKRPKIGYILGFAKKQCEIDYILKFTKRQYVALNDLVQLFGILGRHPRGYLQDSPIVFLNACGTASLDCSKMTSIPDFFLRKAESKGFIGTETVISDRFASEFAKQFYIRFLAGFPLGHALHYTKWHFIDRYSNPMGILYTLYANPDILVECPVRESQKEIERLEGRNYYEIRQEIDGLRHDL